MARTRKYYTEWGSTDQKDKHIMFLLICVSQLCILSCECVAWSNWRDEERKKGSWWWREKQLSWGQSRTQALWRGNLKRCGWDSTWGKRWEADTRHGPWQYCLTVKWVGKVAQDPPPGWRMTDHEWQPRQGSIFCRDKPPSKRSNAKWPTLNKYPYEQN